MNFSKYNIEEADIVIPKRSKTPIKRPQTAANTGRQTKGLFATKNIDRDVQAFDVVDPAGDSGDKILHACSPRLLAIKTKATRLKQERKPTIPTRGRPKTALNPSAAQMMPSLLSNHKLAQLRDPIPESTIQAYQKNIDNEKLSIGFTEDPLAYFSKRKDGRGHRFIYLNYSGDRRNPNFNPYDLTKVPFAEVNPEYFTMSATGVTHIHPNGATENISLDRWANESSHFLTLKKLKLFKFYFIWKPFRIWKNFVMRQRYNQITDKVMRFSFMNNFVFYQTSIDFLKDTPDSIIIKYLLAFQSQKKFTIEEFHQAETDNRQILSEAYNEYLNSIIASLVQLDIDIRDPGRLVVQDSEFSEIKRRNPNLGQLKILERKKHAESMRRNDIVQKEVYAFCDFIRLTDMLIIESLSKSCTESWKIAEDNVSSDMASIFQIEVEFNHEGKVVFQPSLDELVRITKESLHGSLDYLDQLPRLIMSSKLRTRLRENIPTLNQLFENGPSFNEFISCNEIIPQVEDRIIEVITTSYHDAEVISQVFTDFYSIYKTGMTWDPSSYLHERGGKSELIELFTVEDGCPFLSFDPSKELIVIFDEVSSDIAKFTKDQNKLTQFRACTVRGALYIDSRKIRATLGPIPTRCINDIQSLIKDLTQKKTDKITSIMKACTRKFNHEPTNLESYVKFCDFIDKTQRLVPFISAEICSVDEMYDLLQLFPNKQDPQQESTNALHSNFTSFKADIKTAVGLKEVNSDKYLFVLQQELRKYDRKLQKYKDIVTAYPSTIRQTDIDNLLPATIRVKTKIIKLEPKINDLLKWEEILNVKLNDFKIYNIVKVDADLMENVFRSVSKWKEINKEITSVPFSSIDMPLFKEDLMKLESDVKSLKEKNTSDQNPLIEELTANLDGIVPFIVPLEQLSSGKMQIQHWNRLFEECGQPYAYYAQIKIAELLNFGILKDFDKIARITGTSHGESQLENEFNNLLSHWKDVSLPLMTTRIRSEDSLVLGSLNQTFEEIGDTQIELYNMLQNRYVQGIREQVLKLSNELENIAEILSAWEVFQSNWLILSPVFATDEIKSLLPQQTNKFMIVRKRWISLIKHTLENPKLFNVVTFPSLFEMLTENNKTLEILLSSLVKFVDIKRENMPRLFFLSNDEVLQLISTNDFAVFNKHISKIFMNVRGFDSRASETESNENDLTIIGENDKSTAQDFSKLKVYGIINDDGDSLSFDNIVNCEGQVDEWVPNIFKEIKSSFRSNLAASLAKYQSGNMTDWVMAYSSFICILTLQITFSRDTDDNFHNIENNARVFANYENVIQQRIRDMCAAMMSPLAPNELLKLSSVVSLLNYHLYQTRLLSEKYAFYSQKINWSNHLRLMFNLQNSSLHVLFGENQVEHGYEFFGSALQYIHTPSSERLIVNTCNSLFNNNFPLLVGSNGIRRKQLLTYIAANFGNFIYFASSFPDYSFNIISRLFTGAALSGCWLCFVNIQNQTHSNLSFIYEMLRNFSSTLNSGGIRMNINSKIIEIKNTCRFLMTSDSCFLENNDTEIPPQLRSLLKPIACSAPDLRLIAEIKLISFGFKSTKHFSVKITSLLSTISESYEYLHCKEQMKLLTHLLENARDYLRQLMHSKGVSFVNYYESARTAEEYAITRSFYEEFIHNVKEEHIESFFELLYSTFHVFDTFETFKNNLLNWNFFADEIASSLIREEVSKFTSNEYYINQTIILFKLLMNYSCIIICGESYSGKSYIVELLSKAFETLSKNPDAINKFNLIASIKLLDLYMNIDTTSGIFGTSIDDVNVGCIQLSGHLNSYLTNLCKYKRTHHCLLRFNGPITTTFSTYLLEILSGGGKDKGRLSSLDTFSFDQQFHILIETDSLNCISPSLFSICGLLYMSNHMKPIENIFEDRKISLKKESFIDSSYQYLQETFTETIPKVLDYITSITNKFISHVLRGKEYLTVSLPRKCFEYALSIIKATSIDQNNKILLKSVLIVSFYTVYSSVLNNKEKVEFEKWLRVTFSINVPNDWTGFNVPNHFWDIYPRPSLQSVRLFKGAFVPVDFSLLNEKKPLLKKTDRVVSTKFISDLSIPIPQYLPLLYQSMVLSRNMQHIFLHGPKKSGKSHFLNFFFSQNSEFIPVYVPNGPHSTNSTMSIFISTHCSVIKKKYFMLPETKIFALVFENVDPSNLTVVEFIRMIVSSRTIANVSPNDSNFLEVIDLRNYFVIVTGEKIEEFPARFLSMFTPIHLIEPVTSTKKHIFMNNSTFFGLEEKFADKCFSLIEQTAPTNFNIYQPLQSLCFLDEKENKDENSTKVLLSILLNELNFGYFNNRKRTNEEIEKFNNFFKSLFHSEVDSFWKLRKLNILMTNDMKSFKIQSEELDYEDMKIDLEEKLSFYNTKSKAKLHLSISNALIDHVLLLQRAICYPGGSCFLISKPGLNRKSLTKFVCSIKDMKFIDLSLNVDFDSTVRDSLFDIISSSQQFVLFFRATNENICQLKLLIDFIVNHNFSYFFNEEDLINCYLKLNHVQEQSQEQNLSSFYQLIDLFSNKIHVVISINEEDEETMKFVHVFENSSIYCIKFEVNEIDQFSDIATGMLSDLDTIIDVPEKLPYLLSRIHLYIKEEFDDLPLNYFYDLIYEFTNKLKLSKEDIIHKHKQTDIALHFFEDMSKKMIWLDKEITELKPKIDSLQSSTKEMESKFSENKEKISNRSNELQEEEMLKTAEIKKMQDDLAQNKKELIETEQNVESNLLKVKSLQERDIKIIQLSAESPTPKYKAFFELLCIFVENPPTYEPFGLAMATDNSIVSSLTNRIAYKIIPNEVLAAAKQNIQANNFTHSEMEAIAPALGILYDWIHSIYHYANVKQKIKALQKDLDDKQTEYHKYMDETKNDRESIAKLSAELEAEMAKISQSESERVSLEKEFDEKQFKLRNVCALMKNTTKIIDKWKRDSTQFNDDMKLMIGNTVVYASYLVYGGMLNPSQKTSLMTFLSNEMENNLISSTSDSFMYYVASQLEIHDNIEIRSAHSFVSTKSSSNFYQPSKERKTSLINDKKKKKNQQVSHETMRDFHHMRTVRRTPLLIDPDRIVYPFFCSHCVQERLLKISFIASSFKEKLFKAIEFGFTIVVTDVDWLNPFLENVLSTLLFSTTNSYESVAITIEGKTLMKHRDFRLVMFTSKRSIKEIPLDLLCRVTIIDSSCSSLTSLNDAISTAFVNFFDPEMVPRMASVSSSETHYRVEMQRYEQQMFNLISEIKKQLEKAPQKEDDDEEENEKYDFLKDEELLGELLQSKELFFTIMNVSVDFNTIKNEHKMTVEPFLKHIEFCNTIWEAASRYLPLISPNYVLTFDRFLSLVKTGISSSGVKPGLIQDEGHAQLHNSLLNVLMKGLLQSLTFDESIFLMFISSYLKGKKEGKYHDEDLEAIVEHFHEEFHSRIDTHLDDVKSNTNNNEIKEDDFELLKFANVADFYNHVSSFIMSQFSNDFANFLPFFQIESFFSGSAMTPVLIQMKDYVDSTSLLLEHFVQTRNRFDSFELYPLFDNEEALKKVLSNVINAVSKGKWIALQYTKASKNVAQCIANIYYHILANSEKVSTNFRLVVLAHTTQFLPVDFLIASVRISIENNYPSIRHQMLQVYQHHSTSIRSSTNPKLMKKVAYVIVLLYAILNFSSFVKPLGLYEHNIINEMSVKEAIDYIRQTIDSHVMVDLPFRNIRETIQDFFYASKVIDTFDRRKARSLIFSLITPEMIEENFTFLDPSSDEVDRWTIPPDMPITNYMHIIEKIPVFTSCDVILMSRGTSQPILNWNLSRWIARPFICLHKKLKVKSDKSGGATFESLTKMMLNSMPKKIDLTGKMVTSPIFQFFVNEITVFNDAIDSIWDSFYRNENNSVFESLTALTVPEEWREKVGYSGTMNLQRFLGILNQKEKFYRTCYVKNGLSSKEVDCKLITNVKGLLLSFLHQMSFEKNLPVDSMVYEFTFSEVPSPQLMTLTLTNVYLVSGFYDVLTKRLIRIGSGAPPFTKMPPLACTVVKRASKVVRAFQCPLFLSVPLRDSRDEFMLKRQKERIDGEVNNLVYYVPIQSDLTDKQCVIEGTCLVCHMPDVFEP